jgi:Protein of unknown function (DUF1236)
MRKYVMRNSLLISAAAIAVIASSGFAYAQTSREQGGAATQQNNTAMPSNREGKEPSSGMKSTHSEEKSGMKSTPSEEKSGAQSTQKEEKSGKKSTQSEEKSGAAKSKSAEETNPGEKSKSISDSEGKDLKAEGREDRKGMKAEGREDRNGNMKAESKGAAENRSQTTGQAGAGAKLSSEQRTKITTVIRDQHVAPVNNVNFSIVVGSRVPRDVSFHPLPTEIVTIYPDWRGYEFVLVGNQIVVVDPRTFEIVAVLDA